MARIPDAELARLKVEVSVQRLVEGCGVELRQQGKDLVEGFEVEPEALVLGSAFHLRIEVAKCAVERLMRAGGWQGARRQKKIRTTVPDPAGQRAMDLVDRQFRVDAPNRVYMNRGGQTVNPITGETIAPSHPSHPFAHIPLP